MSFQLISIALIFTLASGFVLQNPYCDAANTGAKQITYSAQTLYSMETGFQKLNQNQVMGTHTGNTFDCVQVSLHKGDIYKIINYKDDGFPYTQAYTSSKATEVLGALARVVVVKQFSDAVTYSIGIISNDNTNLETGDLTYVTMPLPTGLVFNKLLNLNGDNLAILFTSDTLSQIHIKNIKSSGVAETIKLVANTKVNALGGNLDCFYDTLSSKFYQSSASDTVPYTQVSSKTTVAGTQFGSVITGTSQSYRLVDANFAIVSYTKSGATVNAYFGWYDGKNTLKTQQSDQGGSLVPIIYTSVYNFMFITSNKFVWAKIATNTNFYANVASTLTAGTPDYIEAKNDFSNGMMATFQRQKAFIISADAIIIYELSNTGPSTTVSKIASTVLSQSIKDLITSGTQVPFTISASCKCSQNKVATLVCFSKTLKCVTTSAPVLSDCTVSYTDTTAQ